MKHLLCMTVLLVCGILPHTAHASDVYSGQGHYFTRHLNQRLRCAIFQKSIANRKACVTKWLNTLKCFSLNYYKIENGSEICELVRTSKSSLPKECFVVEDGCEHDEIQDVDYCSSSSINCKTRAKKVLQDGWYLLGSKVFKLFLERKSWPDAQQACSAIGTNLASISDEMENQFIAEVLLPLIPDKTESEIFKPIGYWKLDGSDTSLTLVGSQVTFVKDEDKKTVVLNIPGTKGSYATTPPLEIRTTSFSMSLWMKMFTKRYTYIYSRWGAPWVFRITFKPWYLQFSIVGFGGTLFVLDGGNVTLNKWYHVTVIWNRELRKAEMYQDGVRVASEIASTELNLTLKQAPTFDVGFKRDSETVMNGRLRQLMVFNRSLTRDEVLGIRDATLFGNLAWLGLNDITTEAAFTWINSAATSYLNFAPDYPGFPGDDLDCVAVRAWDGGKWEDSSCDFKRPYICMAQN